MLQGILRKHVLIYILDNGTKSPYTIFKAYMERLTPWDLVSTGTPPLFLSSAILYYRLTLLFFYGNFFMMLVYHRNSTVRPAYFAVRGCG